MKKLKVQVDVGTLVVEVEYEEGESEDEDENEDLEADVEESVVATVLDDIYGTQFEGDNWTSTSVNPRR